MKVTLDNGLVGWGESQAPCSRWPVPSSAGCLAPSKGRNSKAPGASACRHRMYSTMRVRGQTGGFMLDAIWASTSRSGTWPGSWPASRCRPCSPRAVPRGCAPTLAVCPMRRRRAIPASLSSRCTTNPTGPRSWKKWPRCRAKGRLTRRRTCPKGKSKSTPGCSTRRSRFLECPLPPEDPLAHAELQRAIKTPVAIGESYRPIRELTPFFPGRGDACGL